MSESLNKQLIYQRSIERALENFKKLGKANITASKIRTRIAALKDNWTQFQQGHALLLTTMTEKERTTVDYFKDNGFEVTEDVFQTTWDYLNECLDGLEPVVSLNQSLDHSRVISDASSISQSHMPKISLPPFDGTYSEWESFRDRFSALIISNTSLSDFARMHYLASSLKGSTLDSVSNISVTADNFNLAWNTLTARFENKRRLIASHFATLFGLTAVNKESASELQLLCDKYKIAVSALKNLGRTPTDLWNDFLVYSLTQKLDSATRKAWNLKTSDHASPPEYEELSRFLVSRIRALEECAATSAVKSSKSASASRVLVANASTTTPSACPLCKARHYLSVCSKFINQNPAQRRNTVKQFKRCFNCLSASHSAHECKSKYSCRSCGKKHHTMLHVESNSDLEATPKQDQPVADRVSPNVEVTSLVASTTTRSRPSVLLATAKVKIGTDSGRSVVVRALLDQGSEVTFITESLSQLLRARRRRMPVSISAVGGAQIGTVRYAAAIRISPNSANTPSFSTMALILPSLTSYAPTRSTDLSAFEHLSQLQWADSDPTSSEPIHAIIGADLYSSVIRKGIRRGKDGQPLAQNSAFGWIISGPIPPDQSIPRASLNITVHHCTSLMNLSQAIQGFWATEELPRQPNLSPEDQKCEAHFLETHSRNSNGRYVVRLPFKTPSRLELGSSRHIAECQFNALSRRLASQSVVANEYREFMREYEALGHMCRVSGGGASRDTVYIPHHPVFRADSSTTRLRVVFNASSLTSNGTSLNDHLLSGPKLQTELPSVILCWRQSRFVYSADIAKMYRQILVDPRDRDYQRIIWQPENSVLPCDYQLATVTYGMTCAPFLALRVIKRLVDEEGDQFPLASAILRKNIYIDDVLFGSHDIPSLRETRDQLISLLRLGHFELRKWASNTSALLEDIDPSNHGLACSRPIAADEKVKVLGITWNPARDQFQFQVNREGSCPISKRAILSTIARLYDPLGWVTPVTVAAKIFMQRLWRSRVGWDDEIPAPLLLQWQNLYAQLECLNTLTLDRWTGFQPNSHLELHGFADASTQAYAASVYFKTVSSDLKVRISLLAGKSKVAPITPMTVPRLELSAALLLTRLLSFVRASLDLGTISCFCWTDSTIVLAWLKSHPSRWNTFVANRVLAIQTILPDASWRHVPTLDNPADCASRGLHGNELLDHTLWWQGPPWLKFCNDEWPQTPLLSPVTPLEEKKSVAHVAAVPSATWDLADRFSSWPKLVRITAYIVRFAAACRRRSNKPDRHGANNSILNPDDCSVAKNFWIKSIQASLFPMELHMLANGHSPQSKSSLSALTPFVDACGFLRVGGRLTNAPLPYDVRHPLILAPHPLVRLIAEHAHVRSLHGGLQLTLNTLRQEYWILRARTLVKSVIHQCIVCVRERAATPAQLMGNLPAVRVSPPSRSFAHCGLDYAGPFKVRASAGRGITSRKCYIALFICLATRAIHIETVSDYSASAFLAAFTRFCSRRGLPQSVYSDNGTNFVGAEKELRLAYRSALRDANFQATTRAIKSRGISSPRPLLISAAYGKPAFEV